MAAEERLAAEHAIVIADQLVKVRIAPLIMGIETKPGDLVQSHRADEVFPHAHGAAARDAAAALHAAVEFVDLLR